MKSESKKFQPTNTVDTTNPPKQSKKKWLISYEIYRVTTSITTRVDVGTKIIEAESLLKAYESLRLENHKVVITLMQEL